MFGLQLDSSMSVSVNLISGSAVSPSRSEYSWTRRDVQCSLIHKPCWKVTFDLPVRVTLPCVTADSTEHFITASLGRV